MEKQFTPETKLIQPEDGVWFKPSDLDGHMLNFGTGHCRKIKARRARSDMADYAVQKYIAHNLDANYFNELNDHCSILYSDGLDAPDFIPCGAMQNQGKFMDRITIERGVTLQEQLETQAMVDSLLAELDD